MPWGMISAERTPHAASEHRKVSELGLRQAYRAGVQIALCLLVNDIMSAFVAKYDLRLSSL